MDETLHTKTQNQIDNSTEIPLNLHAKKDTTTQNWRRAAANFARHLCRVVAYNLGICLFSFQHIRGEIEPSTVARPSGRSHTYAHPEALHAVKRRPCRA